MAELNCSACEDLRQDAPNFINYGLTDTECASLGNDTGLNPSSGNDDCEDLNNMNDCLVGNMQEEVDAYEVCDWKEFMKLFIGNVWTVIKGIICAICGIWTNIHELYERFEYLCSLLNVAMNPNAPVYGIFPRNTSSSQIARTCGTIPTINGRPALIDAHATSHNADVYTGVGLRWGKTDSVNCSTGARRHTYFWKPYIWGYELNKDVQIGDALWVITKSQLQSLTEWSDTLWQSYTDESWTWTEHRIVRGADSHKMVWLRLHVGDAGYSNDYLVLTFQGTSYPNAVPNYDALLNEGDSSEYRWATY